MTYCQIDVQLSFFFFNDTATTEIYTLSLHDALPISQLLYRIYYVDGNQWTYFYTDGNGRGQIGLTVPASGTYTIRVEDRKSTRLNSSHGYISYAVFCLKKKKYVDIGDRIRY